LRRVLDAAGCAAGRASGRGAYDNAFLTQHSRRRAGPRRATRLPTGRLSSGALDPVRGGLTFRLRPVGAQSPNG
jgi:hypothetical protein